MLGNKLKIGKCIKSLIECVDAKSIAAILIYRLYEFFCRRAFVYSLPRKNSFGTLFLLICAQFSVPSRHRKCGEIIVLIKELKPNTWNLIIRVCQFKDLFAISIYLKFFEEFKLNFRAKCLPKFVSIIDFLIRFRTKMSTGVNVPLITLGCGNPKYNLCQFILSSICSYRKLAGDTENSLWTTNQLKLLHKFALKRLFRYFQWIRLRNDVKKVKWIQNWLQINLQIYINNTKLRLCVITRDFVVLSEKNL